MFSCFAIPPDLSLPQTPAPAQNPFLFYAFVVAFVLVFVVFSYAFVVAFVVVFVVFSEGGGGGMRSIQLITAE